MFNKTEDRLGAVERSLEKLRTDFRQSQCTHKYQFVLIDTPSDCCVGFADPFFGPAAYFKCSKCGKRKTRCTSALSKEERDALRTLGHVIAEPTVYSNAAPTPVQKKRSKK